MKIAITGATGFVGKALIPELQKRGHAVVALTRRLDSARQILGTSVEACLWTQKDHPVLPSCDAIIHLAGESVFGRWTVKKKAAIRDSRVQGTRTLVEAILRMETRPSLFLSASAIGIYGPRGDESLTETSAAGDGFLAQVTQDWEREALLAEELGLRVVCLRVGIVLDRGGGAFRLMLPPFQWGLGGRLGDGRQWMSWIHRNDLVRLFLFALENSRVHGPMNATAPQPVRNADFTRTLARTLHRPAILPVPAFALKIALGEFSDALLESQRVLPAAAELAGFKFGFPALEGAFTEILANRSTR